MKAYKKNSLALSAVILCGLFSQTAKAVTRVVYFNGSGTNRTVEGLSAAATSTCKITLSNPSSVSQTYIINASPTSINNWSGGSATVTIAASAPTLVSGSGACAATCTGTLTAGQSVTVSYSYTAFPARPAGITAFSGKQQLRCTGSITASDVTPTNPGFLIASGTLITFVETARMNTDSTTGGTTLFGGIAIYTQVPIAINRSKPF